MITFKFVQYVNTKFLHFEKQNFCLHIALFKFS